MPSASMPKTASSWRRFKFSLRSLISTYLLTWAADIAPEEEKTSIYLAIHEHFERAINIEPKG